MDENRDSIDNIWRTIRNYSECLGSDNLPFAQDDYGGVFFLKWVEGKAQVWLFQYGDQPFADKEDDNIDDYDKMRTSTSFLFDSINDFLEAL